MNNTILPDIPDTIRETVLAEIEARNFSETETRWLTALLIDKPLMPAPTAAAMVARVAGQPLGRTLLALETVLAELPDPSPALLPAERRMTTVILQSVAARLTKILSRLTTGALL